jgi:hypothetical protein
MSQDAVEPRIPDIVLERYRLNELPTICLRLNAGR